jgi:sRNA-binding regulator protein Hfq
MKKLQTKPALALVLISLTLWSLIVSIQSTSTSIKTLALLQNRKESKSIIPISFPLESTIKLINGTSKSGRIVEFDSQVVRLSKSSEPVLIQEVKKILFREDSVVYNRSGDYVIRGSNNNKSTAFSWLVSLNKLRLKDYKIGSAEIDLIEIDSLKAKGAVNTAKNNSTTFVVSEIEYKEGSKMIVKGKTVSSQ